MKKWMTLLLCCVLALNLTACGAGAPGGPEDNAPPQASTLHFEVATQVYENEYKADDGTVLLAERYELPVLELRTEDGELYTLAENVTANGGTGNPAQFTAQNAFNTEMNNVLAGLESEAAQMAAEAKELYAGKRHIGLFERKLLDERAEPDADLHDRGEVPEHRGGELHLLRRRASEFRHPRVEL